MSVTFASRPAVNGVVGAGRNAVSYVVQRLAGLQRLSWRPQLRPAFFRRSDLRNAHIIEFRRSDPHFSAVPTGATPTSSNSAVPTRIVPPIRLAQRPHHRIPQLRPALFRRSDWRNAHIIEFRSSDPHFSADPTCATPTSSNSAVPTRIFPPFRLAQRPHHRIPQLRPAFFRRSDLRNAHIIEFRRSDPHFSATPTGATPTSSNSAVPTCVDRRPQGRSVPRRPPSSRAAPRRTIGPYRVDLQAKRHHQIALTARGPHRVAL